MRIQREKDYEKLEQLRPLLPYYVSEYIQISLDSLTPTTVLSYALDIQDFLEWMWHSIVPGKNSIMEITLEDIERLIEMDISHYRSYLKNRQDSHNKGNRYYKTKNKDSTISRKISALRNLFEFLHTHTNRETGSIYLSKNIMENTKVSMKKTSAKAKAEKLKSNILRNQELTDFQDFIMVGYGEGALSSNGEVKELSKMQRAYWNINRSRDAAIVSLLLGSGLRVGELISLRLKDINVEERKLLVDRKRGKEDIVFFPKQTQEYLRDYLEIRQNVFKAASGPNEPLFLTKYAGKVNPISKNTIQKMVMKYAKAYGKDMTPHSLRHSFGTYLFKKTKNIRGVQKALGHESMETTQIYTHMFEDDDRDLIDQAFE
ncbi:tyrosine recombinase XerS [Cytobacillus oceanisediminis]|uniref:tyrosine recombinase XerS n=1 Tax=Cytobacillus oceanisediminis TaxID=665099 RepID=UPI001FB1F195|nr:tyrosine recombinase XerS [Cytobacillus oceanisediminis]UOE58017.1 tyrosine recombinase XerS [Cytobacillus oceanisediminis]